jgi:ADP-heptose:LPS heptosyltransferase
MLPGVAGVLEWDCPWITASAPPVSAAHLDRLGELVRGVAPEAAVILTSFHQSPLPLALQLRLAGVPRIAGASVDFAGTLLDVRLKPGEDFPEDQPEPLRALGIARAAGFTLPKGDDGALRVTGLGPLPAALGRFAGDVDGGLDGELESGSAGGSGRYVVVHPGASVPSRRWPEGHHARVVELLRDAGVDVVVTGGPDEVELTRQVTGGDGAARRGDVIDLGGDTPLPVLAAVLAGASVVVSGNTGPAHIAAAVGTPVVSLFSPVVPAERWAPYGVPHVLLGDQQAACRGTRATECPVLGHPCLTSVTPEQVVEACFALAPALRAPALQAPAREAAAPQEAALQKEGAVR